MTNSSTSLIVLKVTAVLTALLSIWQAVVGFGGAEKRQVMDMTRRLLHMEKVARPDDAADAIAIALCHARSTTSLLSQHGLIYERSPCFII